MGNGGNPETLVSSCRSSSSFFFFLFSFFLFFVSWGFKFLRFSFYSVSGILSWEKVGVEREREEMLDVGSLGVWIWGFIWEDEDSVAPVSTVGRLHVGYAADSEDFVFNGRWRLVRCTRVGRALERG